MKVRVGQSVTFRDDLVVDKLYGRLHFVEGMKDVVGRTYEIRYVDNPSGGTVFGIGVGVDGGECRFYYSVDMIEKIVDDFTNINLTFYNTEKRLPNTSGDYLCYVNNKYLTTLNYSSKWELFNTQDYYDTREEALETAIVDVTCWAELPEKIF